MVTLPPVLPMDRSEDRKLKVTDAKCAVQQSHAPRPLPLFLELVRLVSEQDPELAAKAIEGLGKYEDARRLEPRGVRPVLARQGAATLRDHGGTGAPLVLIPSLIN